MHKEHVLIKIAALTSNMVDKVIDKLKDANKYHLSFIKDPEYTLSKAKLLYDEGAKLFLQQNKYIKNSDDVKKVIEKNLNAYAQFEGGRTFAGKPLGFITDYEYDLLKSLKGASRVNAKKDIEHTTSLIMEGTKDLYTKLYKNVRTDNKYKSNNLVTEALKTALVNNLESKNTKKGDRVLKNILRKTWHERKVDPLEVSR
jgi:hypothetical protein